MKSQQLQQPILTARHVQNRRWQWLGIGMISSIAAATIAFSTAPVRDPQALPIQQHMTMPIVIDPAAQSVNDYLRAHASVRQVTVIDPATQSVNDYLRAHATVGQLAAIDPAMQSVNDYLRAHASIDQAAAVDPATQSVNDYLRAHASIDQAAA
ncbi:MAG: hypothetical protein ABI901_08010, partial [Roseiflexaceae bacterium]